MANNLYLNYYEIENNANLLAFVAPNKCKKCSCRESLSGKRSFCLMSDTCAHRLAFNPRRKPARKAE